jgi:hypothetical protein
LARPGHSISEISVHQNMLVSDGILGLLIWLLLCFYRLFIWLLLYLFSILFLNLILILHVSMLWLYSSMFVNNGARIP